MSPSAAPTAPPDAPADGFRARLASLSQSLRQARDQLRHAADAIDEDGQPPGFALVDAVAACHRDFLSLRREVADAAEAKGTPVPAAGRPTGLAGLEAWINCLETRPDSPRPTPRDAVEIFPGETFTIPTTAPAPTDPIEMESDPALAPVIETTVQTPPPSENLDAAIPEPSEVAPARDEALRVLDRFLTLRAKRPPAPPELAPCLEQARALRESIAAGGDLPETAELAAGAHPMAALLALIGPSGTIDDSAWAEQHARVVAGLGRALALAAARDRLTYEP